MDMIIAMFLFIDCKDKKNFHPNQIIDVLKKAEGLKDHRQAVKCKARNPC